MADETSDFTSSLLLTFLCSKYLTYGGDSLILGLKKKPILQFLNVQFPHHLICNILGSNERITRCWSFRQEAATDIIAFSEHSPHLNAERLSNSDRPNDSGRKSGCT